MIMIKNIDSQVLFFFLCSVYCIFFVVVVESLLHYFIIQELHIKLSNSREISSTRESLRYNVHYRHDIV